MKEVLSIIEKVCTLKARDSEVQAFFKFIESYFFKELPNACGVKNMSEVEKKMGAQFNTLTLVMFEAFLSTYCKSTNGVWNVLEVAIKRGVFSKKEEGIAKAFLNSYLGLYKVEISHGNLVLEDLVDLGEKLNIQSAPSHLLTVPKDIALALRVIHVKEGLVVTQGFLAFPIETARHHLAPFVLLHPKILL